MKAISLWQPWASAIALGIKTIETRDWATRYRGLLLIHAAKTFPKAAKDFAAEELAFGRGIERVPLGALIAAVDLTAVYPAELLDLRISALERRYGNYSAGRFGWQFENIRPFKEPIGYCGSQRIFNVPDHVVSKALRQIGFTC